MLKYFKEFKSINTGAIPNPLFNLTKFETFYNIHSYKISIQEREKMKIKFKKMMKNNKLKKINKEQKISIKESNVIVEHPQLSEKMKKEMDLQVENFNSINVLSDNYKERFDAHEYLKILDSSFEGFFFKREFNQNNFNYYIQVLSRQDKLIEAEKALEKMEEMNIEPNIDTYNQLMVGYARAKNISKCEEIFDLVKNKKKMVPNKFIYTTLLQGYAKNMKVKECEAILKEMRDEGLEPDTVCYTALINAFKRVNNYKKCWELYYEACANNVVDEFLMSFMVRLCSATAESERALSIFQMMDVKGFSKYTVTYNSIIFALSARSDYAEQAIEMFQKMKAEGHKPDLYTYVGVLRATSYLGDINMANDIVKEIRVLNLPINHYICSGLLRTYAGASRLQYVKTEHIESYINDAWEIYKYMEKENIKIDVRVLNSLLEVHTANQKYEMVDGLVLPLFEKHSIKMNAYTYEKIFRMLLDIRKYDAILDLYAKMKNNEVVPNNRILNVYLESCMRTNDSDGIVEALQMIHKLDKVPDSWLIRRLSNFFDLPDRIFVELQNFPIFNILKKERWKMFSPAQFRERERTPVKAPHRINNKRIKLKK